MACMENVYKIIRPDSALPLVFDSPHSGRDYPDDFGHACALSALQSAEDNHVDELFETAPRYGATLLCALFPRTYIDANRAEADIDTGLVDGKWTGPLKPSSRSHAGIGLIRRLIRPGVPIYDRRLRPEEIKRRIERCYRPYHAALKNLLDESHYNFGQIWHINAHSMPSAPGQADFVIGDRDGTSCDPAFTAALRDFIAGMGYRAAVNHPYKGVEILRRHGNPAEGRHSLQLEISKALYWDERENRKGRNFQMLRDDIERLIAFCAAWTSDQTAFDLAAD